MKATCHLEPALVVVEMLWFAGVIRCTSFVMGICFVVWDFLEDALIGMGVSSSVCVLLGGVLKNSWRK